MKLEEMKVCHEEGYVIFEDHYDVVYLQIAKELIAKINKLDYNDGETMVDYGDGRGEDYIYHPTIDGISEEEFSFTSEELQKVLDRIRL